MLIKDHIKRLLVLLGLVLALLTGSVPSIGSDSIPITRLNIDRGLSNNSVRCIFQDHNGFMWFGTYDGLNRYDGYDFKVFRNVLEDTNSLPHNFIYVITEDSSYSLWIGTGQGIGIYDLVTSKFHLASYQRQDNGEINRIISHVNHGGNILMVQVENEYGAYGSDREYLDINRKMFIEAGFDGLLYTCDPEPFLAKGNLPGKLFTSINGLDKPARIKQLIKQNNEGRGPFFVAEWYPAWFDWWGTQHHRVPAGKYTPGLDSVLSAGMSVNMYMFHGGTTRDFMNGANYNDQNPYEPQISSYDYDAPLDEAGNPTHKFMEFRKVIQKSLPAGHTLPEVPAVKPTIAIPVISFATTTSLFDVLPGAKTNATPLTFEDLNQAYGFVLYRTTIDGGSEGALKIKDLRDYGIVFINGKHIGVLDRRLKQDSIWLRLPKGKLQLDVLVENLGRINYGPYLLKNKKGITEGVSFNGKELKGWRMFPLPFNDMEAVPLKKSKSSSEAPAFKKGTFNLQAVGDTYLDLSNWGKGVVWVNGHNLGRYWNIGPQQTLYIPVEWLKKGENEIIVLELLKPEQSQLQTIEKPILDQLSTKAQEKEHYK